MVNVLVMQIIVREFNTEYLYQVYKYRGIYLGSKKKKGGGYAEEKREREEIKVRGRG